MAIGTTSNMEWLSGGGSGTSYNAGTGIDISNNTISVKIDGTTITTNSSGELVANGGGVSQVQSDWTQTNDQAVDFIKNKPQNLVQDANYVHTDNNFTNSDKNKLDGIEAGAEANVQSDWNVSDNTSDAFIRNKPDLSQYATQSDLAGKQDTLTAGQNISIVNNVISATGGTQLQSNWTENDSTSVQYILNKPQNLVQDANYVHTDNNFTNTEKNKLAGIEAGAEVNVQSDWSVTDTSSDAYIANKPTIITPVQSDWNQQDSSQLDFIKNKPSVLGQAKDLVAGTNITLQQNSNSVIISAQYAGATYNTQQISGIGHILVSSTAQISTDLTDSGEIVAYFRCQCDQVNGWPGPSSNVDNRGAQFAMNNTIETTDFIDYTGGVFTENHFKNLAQYGYLDAYSGYMYSIDFNSDGLIVPYIGVNSESMVFELAQEQTSSSDKILKQVGFANTEAPISLMCDVIGGKRVKLNMYGVSATQTPSRGLHAHLCFPCFSVVVRRI